MRKITAVTFAVLALAGCATSEGSSDTTGSAPPLTLDTATKAAPATTAYEHETYDEASAEFDSWTPVEQMQFCAELATLGADGMAARLTGLLGVTDDPDGDVLAWVKHAAISECV